MALMPPSMIAPFALAAHQVHGIGGGAQHPQASANFDRRVLNQHAEAPFLCAFPAANSAAPKRPDELRLGRHEHRPAERLLDQPDQHRVVGHHAAGHHQRRRRRCPSPAPA